MKSKTLTLRISSTLRIGIEKIAHENQEKISDTVREILNNHIIEKKITESKNIFEESFSNLTRVDFFNSNQFIYLYSWITDKLNNQYNNKSTVDETTLLKIKDILLSTISNSVISSEAKHEFEKILQDVLKYQNDIDYNKCLKFNTRGYSTTIDFKIINDFLFNHMERRL